MTAEPQGALDVPGAGNPVTARSAWHLRARLQGAAAAAIGLTTQHALILIVGLAALLVIAPLLRPGYFWGAHDARHDVYFIFEYDQAVREGNWFPRWGQDWAFGYGYPFWIIYAPLAVFVGELFHHFAGFDWEASVKAVLAVSIVLSGLGMYGLVHDWLGRKAGLLAAVAYMVFPYHLVDVYVRAALPESMALALFPFVLWAFRATVLRPRLLNIIAAGLAYAALMWTHNLSAVIFTPGLAIYVVALLAWQELERRRAEPARDRRHGIYWRSLLGQAWAPALAVVLGLGLSAGFFIPAMAEARNVNQAQWFGQYYNPFRHFVYLNQLFNPAWGFGISQPGPDDVAQGSLSYQLGAVPLLLTMVTLATLARLQRPQRRELLLLAAWGAVAILLTLGVSAPLWHLPLVPLAQFPWRYLMLAALPLSVLAGAVVAETNLKDPKDRPRDQTSHGDASRSNVPRGCFAIKRQEPGLLRSSADPEQRDAEPARPDPPRVAFDFWPTALLVALVLLGSYPFLQVQMQEPTPEQGPVSFTAMMRFQRTSDEMTGVTAWVDPQRRPNWSSMADVWLKGQTLRTRVDYTHVPQSKTLAVNAEGMGTDYEEIYYYTDFPGKRITFDRFWYPGWRAYLLDGRHGRPVRELPVLREDGPLARIVLPVPQGEGFILLRFEDTPLRAAAKAITYGSMALAAIVLAAAGIRALRASRLRGGTKPA